MNTDAAEALQRRQEALVLIAYKHAVENQSRTTCQREEDELRITRYTLTGTSARRLVSDVLFLVLRNLSRGQDLRSFHLTCTHWNQSFLDNLSAFTDAGHLWDVGRSVGSFKSPQPADNPSAAFIYKCSQWKDSYPFIGKYYASGEIHSLAETTHNEFVFMPTQEGLWTISGGPAGFVVYFPDGTRFIYIQTVSSPTASHLTLSLEQSNEVIIRYYSAEDCVGLTAKWVSAQADFAWNTVVRDISDLIRDNQLRCIWNSSPTQPRRPSNWLLREAVETWRIAYNTRTS